MSGAKPSMGSGQNQPPTPVGLVTRNFLALGSGEALARAIAFLATIYVARTLGAAYFGITAFSAAVILYLGRIVDGGLDAGLGIQLIASKKSRVEQLGVTLLGARLLMAMALALLLLLVGTLLLPQPDGTVLAAYGLLLFPLALSTRWIHLGLEKARSLAVARVLGELTMVCLVLLVVRAPGDLVRVPLAQFAGDALTGMLLLGLLLRWGFRLRSAFHTEVLRAILGRSLPLVASSLLGLLLYNSDLLFLRFFRDTSTVGYYVASYALISFIGNLTTAYGASLLPTLARLRPRPTDQLSLYHTSTANALALALPATVGVGILAPDIILAVFGETYAPAALPLQILIWTVMLGVSRDLAMVALLASGREDRILRMNTWATGLNVSTNLIAVPLFGMIGAAATTVATEVVRLLMAQRFAGREGFSPPDLRRLWRPVAATAVMAAAVGVSREFALWTVVALGAGAYASVMLATGGLRIRRGVFQLDL